MSDKISSGASLTELARERRAALSQPHPADLEAARLRQKLNETEEQLQRAGRGARRRSAAAYDRQKAKHTHIGRTYQQSRQQAGTVARLIKERDMLRRHKERWRQIATIQRHDPGGVIVLSHSLDAARERCTIAEARVKELSLLLQHSSAELEDLRHYRHRWIEANTQIREMQSTLSSVAETLRSGTDWTVTVESGLGELLRTYGVPPPPQTPPASA